MPRMKRDMVTPQDKGSQGDGNKKKGEKYKLDSQYSIAGTRYGLGRDRRFNKHLVVDPIGNGG